MDRWSGKVAIVTGASVGIGAAITEALVSHGMKVVAVARRLENLQALAARLEGCKGKVYPQQCDLRKEEDILKVFKWTEEQLGGVDVLVNNAGVLGSGSITDSSTDTYRMILDVNVIAVAICTRETIRSLKKRKAAGHILNINSLAGHFASSISIPLNLYPASKYAVTGMTHGLRNEVNMQNLNVKITSISPGAVKTDMIASTGLPDKILQSMPMLRDKEIADAVIYALGTPPNVHVLELMISPPDTFGEFHKTWLTKE